MGSADHSEAVKKVYSYLMDAQTFYLATIDGDSPRVRPFGAVLLRDDRLYLVTGKKKDVSKQISANPSVEICACQGGTWLRIACRLEEDDNRNVKVEMLEKMPSLKALYDPDDGNMQMLFMKDAKAVFSSFTEAPETVEF